MVEEARGVALRQGNWKYIQGTKNRKGKVKKGQLYNLQSDIGEQHNIIDQHAERAKSMDKLLNKIKQNKAGIRSNS